MALKKCIKISVHLHAKPLKCLTPSKTPWPMQDDPILLVDIFRPYASLTCIRTIRSIMHPHPFEPYRYTPISFIMHESCMTITGIIWRKPADKRLPTLLTGSCLSLRMRLPIITCPLRTRRILDCVNGINTFQPLTLNDIFVPSYLKASMQSYLC